MKPHFERVQTNGITLRVALAGSGPLILLVHGFPESWYSWRHQFTSLVKAGYRVAAPDVRGYGGSDAPYPVSAYSLKEMVCDIAGLIDALSEDGQAILVGHDHGAPMVWQTALRFAGKVRAVAGLSVPHTPPGDRSYPEFYKAAFTSKGRFFYQACFEIEGEAEAELEADIPASIRRFYYALSGDAPDGTWPKDKRHGDPLLYRLPEPATPMSWLTPEDITYLTNEFEQSGFRGPCNRYRCGEMDFAYLRELDNFCIYQPSLFIGGERDLVLKTSKTNMVHQMRDLLTDCRGVHMLQDCGHWTQQERPADVNHLLLDWLEEIRG